MRLLLLPLLTGCVSQAMLAGEFSALQEEIATAHASTNCAPRDLAIADANVEFAKIEFEEGDTRRATEHVQLARTHAKIAIACGGGTPAPVVPPTPPPTPVQPPPVATTPPDSPWAATPTTTVATRTDTDRDGVADADDVCVSDAEDLDGFKDADGCPDLDDDGDGVADMIDRCPREPEDRDGFEDGDGCLDIDNDRDGVADAQDACPAQPGPPPSGCAVVDRDRDGVDDSKDACADQPETVNGYNDADGCPDTKPQRVEVTADQIVIRQKVNFATGKATILPDSFSVLDDVAQAMKDNPQLRVEIGGHTDNVGDDAQNQRLSKDRADAVWEYLLSKGVAATRMTTMGYGETRPIDTNMTESGRNNNRRVEFVIQK